LHLGTKHCAEDKLKRKIKEINDDPWALWIGMGDYAECINKDDRRFDWDSVDRTLATPDEQFDWLAEVLAPIGDKCLGLLKGNHEYELYQRYNHDYVKDLAKDLGAEPWVYSAFVRLRFNRDRHRTKFDVYLHHGKTAARSKGGKINKLRSMDQIFEADIYAMAHVHDVEADKRPYLTVDSKLNIVEKRKLYVLTGGFSRGYVDDITTYVERNMYAPTTLGAMFLQFTPEKHVFPAVRALEIPVMPAEVLA